MTVEERLAMMSVSEYDASLDLMAIAASGEIAACCMGSINREENRLTGCNQGATDPIATRLHYQRRGLAKALLLTALHKLRDRGAETAMLGTSGDNTAILKIAASVGSRVRFAAVWFSRPISLTAPL
jgi:ribosomal protein S18 acetylase RimI-like enzyme